MVIFIKVQEEIIYIYIILKIKELEKILQIFLLEVLIMLFDKILIWKLLIILKIVKAMVL